MDANRVSNVDLTTAPEILRRPEPAPKPALRTPKSNPLRTDAPFLRSMSFRPMSFGWSAALFVASIATIIVFEVFVARFDPNAMPDLVVAPVDPNVALPGFVIGPVDASPRLALTVVLELSMLALLVTPLLAMIRTRGAALVGIAGGLGVLGLQAECFVGGHTGFFATPFLAINAAMVGLVAVGVAALTRR